MRKLDGKLASAVPQTGEESQSSKGAAVSVDPNGLIASDNPVAIVDVRGQVISANPPGRELMWAAFALTESSDRLRELVNKSRQTGAVASARLTLRHLSTGDGSDDFQDVQVEFTPLEPNSRTYDIFVVPTGGEESEAILLAREVTFEHNLTKALTSSRGLFKDLVSCSADFSWEVDQTGSFTYVGPYGALGYSSLELNGSPVNILFADEETSQQTIDTFQSAQDVRETTVQLVAKDGEVRHFSMSSKPIFDEQQRQVGNRGVGRDITELVEQRKKLDCAKRRQDALNAVLTATTSSLDPSVVLEKATRALTSSIGAAHGLLYLLDPENQRTGSKQLSPDVVAVQESDLWRNKISGEEETVDLVASLRPFALQSLQKAQDRAELMVDNWRHLIWSTQFQDRVNGVVCVSRPISLNPWTDDERELFSDLAQTIGIAIGQANQTRELTTLSRQDPLTQLLNRRSFEAEVSTRLQHLRRHSRPSALLYIDLDNFKTINDSYGHHTGDKVLLALARVLQDNLRTGDLAVRFGGDEFGIWLEETDQPGAEAKANQILSLIGQLQKTLGLAIPVEASIGIAPLSSGRNMCIEELAAIADEALYEAKAAGKGRYRVWSANDKKNQKTEEPLC